MNMFLQYFLSVSKSNAYQWFIVHNVWLLAIGFFMVTMGGFGTADLRSIIFLIVFGINNLIGLWKVM